MRVAAPSSKLRSLTKDISKSLTQGCIAPIGEQPRGNWYSAILKSLAFHYDFNFTTPWKNLTQEVKNMNYKIMYMKLFYKVIFINKKVFWITT